MVLYASIFLIGALFMTLVFVAVRYLAGQRGPETYSGFTQSESRTGEGFWSAHVGTLGEPTKSTADSEQPAWKLYDEAINGRMANVYRTRSTFSAGSQHWDPYSEAQSRANRAKAARRKPRPHRSAGYAETRVRPGASPDVYALLGVPMDATSRDIERAFRGQVAHIHPDRFFDDPLTREHAQEHLKQLNAAMEILRDPSRRAKYDMSHVP